MKNMLTAVVLTAACLCSAAFAQTKSGTAPKAAPARPNLLEPSTLKATAPATYRVKFTTTKGDVIIEVTRAWAPRGADRFYNLVRAGFFTDAAFFRVISGFMAQFGLSAKPDVSAVWEKARIMDDPVTQTNKRGRITFATAGPNTRTTQLFINFGDNARLDGQGFAPFGEVVEGMDVVDKINPEYQEQPDQGKIQQQGKAYLDRYFPRLDRILSASIVPATPPAAKQ
ncbi:MAG: peptidylprolyl isomerase [Bryobacteraceae bacterium]|jgi:peptidyl-prolyl cis-trans isomerase A (cyclophilin A)